ncbi:MAG: hypothetical protein NTY41_16295, partial [Proteobacteria bacterium]|nr:hypothetical protein [Pseudomonadota bacterium]
MEQLGGDSLMTDYWHAALLALVSIGEGQLVGSAGNTGENTGHLAVGVAVDEIDGTLEVVGAGDDVIGGQLDVVEEYLALGQRPLEEVAPGLMLRAAEQENDVGRLTDSFHLNLTAFGFLAFAVGIFIVHGAIGLAFEQRRPVVRTLRALGVPLSVVIGLMAVELAVLA